MRRDCPWFPASSWLYVRAGSSRRREESLRGQRAAPGARLSHAAAAAVTAGRAGISPAAIRASHIVPVVITAHTQRSRAAAHAVRACPSASRFPSRPVRCACFAARTLLWRSAPQTARQAAARRAGRPRREIRVWPLIVADVCSDGFSPACLTTARPDVKRCRSPVSARITAPDRADMPSMLATSSARPSSPSTPPVA